MSAAKIRKLITGVHMGLGHDGLRALLAKPANKGGASLNLDDLRTGDLVMVLNTAGDKLKVIGHKGLVIGYLKMPNKAKITLDALKFIPETFSGQGFDYDAACRKSLDERFGRARPSTSPMDIARAKQAAGV